MNQETRDRLDNLEKEIAALKSDDSLKFASFVFGNWKFITVLATILAFFYEVLRHIIGKCSP